MPPPRKQDGAERRPRLSVVRSELRLCESGLGGERMRRPLAHRIEYDDRGLPVDQPPLILADRLARLVTR